MSNTNQATQEASTEEKKEPAVRINRDRYTATKTASGQKSLNNGDEVAATLDGLNIDELFKIGVTMLEEDFTEKYSKLNVGMQRMNMGNRLRAKVKTIDADEKNEDGTGLKKLQKAASPFVKERDARLATAAKEKEAKQKEREEKAATAKKAKAEKAEAKVKKEKEATKATTKK